MSGQATYDVYVKEGVDQMGREEFGETVAHFVERGNAVALKRRLIARGERVHVVRSIVHGLSRPARSGGEPLSAATRTTHHCAAP